MSHGMNEADNNVAFKCSLVMILDGVVVRMLEDDDRALITHCHVALVALMYIVVDEVAGIVCCCERCW